MVPRMDVFFSEGVPPCGVLALMFPNDTDVTSTDTTLSLPGYLTHRPGRKGLRMGCRRGAGTHFCISLSQGQNPENIHNDVHALSPKL